MTAAQQFEPIFNLGLFLTMLKKNPDETIIMKKKKAI